MKGVRGELMGKIDCSVEKILKLYLKLDEHKKQEFLVYLEKNMRRDKNKLMHYISALGANRNSRSK